MYKVILAEDNYSQRRSLVKVDYPMVDMELIGDFHCGEEALEAHKKNPADLIITDIRMPGMTGIEFLDEARKISSDTLFIITSAYAEFEYAKKAIDLGVCAYILKPYTKKELIEALKGVQQTLDKRRGLIDKDYLVDQMLEESNVLFHLLNLKATNLPVDTQICVCGFKPDKKAELKVADLLQETRQDYFRYEDKYFCLYLEANIEKIRSHMNYMTNYFHRTQSLFFAGQICLNKELRKSMETAVQAFEFAYVDKSGIGCYEYQGKQIMRPRQSYYIDKKQIVERVLHDDRKGLDVLLKEIYTSVITNQYQHNSMMDQCRQLITEINKLLMDKGLEKINSHFIEGSSCFQSMYEELVVAVNLAMGQLLDAKNYSNNIKKALHYMKLHYVEADLSLEDLAEHVSCGYAALSRDFHKETGFTFKDYLSNYRIDMAKQLLLTTTLNIMQIANLVGLSQKNFNRLFTKYCKKTPTEYRQGIMNFTKLPFDPQTISK